MADRQHISVDVTVSPQLDVPRVDRVERLLRFAAEQENRSGEVGVWLCDDDEIADLHLRFMQISGPTDVISFPGEEGYLGDIAVSVDTAAVQAAEAGHSTGREIGYLTLHGLLHLFGYDDIDPEDRQRMIDRQDRLIEQFDRESPGVWE